MTEARTAIVTGAGKRVGAAITRGLLDDGWQVVAHVHHATDDVPQGAVKVVSDLTDPTVATSCYLSLLHNRCSPLPGPDSRPMCPKG